MSAVIPSELLSINHNAVWRAHAPKFNREKFREERFQRKVDLMNSSRGIRARRVADKGEASRDRLCVKRVSVLGR